jgi:tripartite-type tricarboxylate transporter receptor subunit TctC
MINRIVAAALVVGLAAATPAAVRADDFPSETIRLILPFAPGGFPDVMGRLVAEKVSAATHVPVIVENKAGPGGMAMAGDLSRARPDGRTIFLVETSIYAITPALVSAMPFDVVRDFAPVTLAMSGPLFFVKNTNFAPNSIPELVAHTKKNPGLTYGSVAVGSSHHLAMAQFAQMAGLTMTHIPYKGANEATPAIVAGEVPIMFITLPSILGHLKTGKLKILAAGSPQRSKLMPDVPTMAELGFTGFESMTKLGFLVRAGTPAPIVARINEEFSKALNSPEVQARVTAIGMEVEASSPEQFGAIIKSERTYYGDLIKQVGVKTY